MSAQLLATKLFVLRPRPGLVARPRLVERLNGALNSGLLLVSAPAGFGKTTAIVQWTAAQASHLPVAWLQVDEADNDPVRFWDYVIASVRTIAPAIGDAALTMLRSPQLYTTEAMLTSLINDIVNTTSELILVIDDYHLIKSDAVHSAVTFLIDHCPANMHFIIATRVDPKLPLAHFRGRGTIVEIGADDLRFTDEETTDFFDLQDVHLEPEDISALNAQTEGWVVGLKMAGLAMRGRKDAHEFLTSFTGSQRYVMDYLVEEVLGNQPPEVTQFLLTTSVLERMTPSLCDYLTGQSNGREMLSSLERSKLFLVPLDETRQWYRYHHLFADLLRHQLEVQSGEETVKRLHQQASQWHEKQAMMDDAIHHALAAQDWECAMRLVSSLAEGRSKNGETVTVFEWLKAIPESILSCDFYLYRLYARGLIETGHLDAVETVLSNLQRAAQDNANLEGEISYFQADVAQRRGDLARAIEMGERAVSHLSPDNAIYRGWAMQVLGFNQHYCGLLEPGFAHLNKAFEIAKQSGDRYAAAWAANFMAAILHERGHLQSALDVAGRGLKFAAQSPAAAGPCCRLCIVPYEMNDLDGAEQSAKLALQWCGLTGDSTAVVAYLYLAMIHLARGDTSAAVEAMVKCDAAVRDPRVSPLFQARHAAGRVTFAIRLGDIETASRWGRRLSDYADCFPFEFAHVPARLLIAQAKEAEAAAQLRTIHENAIKAGAQGLAIGIRVCQALSSGTEDEAVTFLADALKNGEPEGYVRTFVDEGRLLAPLLRKAISQGITPDYAGKLLRIIEAEKRQSTLAQAPHLGAKRSAVLSDRELEILRLLEAGLSNRQIAGQLVISVPTVKTHVHNIGRKLDASRRTQVLARARELKLV